MAENPEPDPTPADLPETEAKRWAAYGDALGELVQGADDDEAFGAAFAQMGQIAGGLDYKTFLNSMHVPEDAGEYEPALRRLLARIPDGWGRWISCDAGWYGILARLEPDLAALSPAFRVQQLKEKFGSLRVYVSFGQGDFSDGSAFPESEPDYPDADTVERDFAGDADAAGDAWQEAFDAYTARREAWEATAEGIAAQSALAARMAAFDARVNAAEKEAEHTCERCGEPGHSQCTRAASPWYKTLCDACAEPLGYMRSADYAAWWAEEKPRFEEHMREHTRERFGDKVALCLSADETQELVVPARYVRDAVEAFEAAFEEGIDEVWVGDDAVGRAYMEGLAARYAEHLAEATKMREEAGDRYRSTRRPEDAPSIHYLHRRLPCEKMFMQDHGFSGWLAQSYYVTAESWAIESVRSREQAEQEHAERQAKRAEEQAAKAAAKAADDAASDADADTN